MTCRTSTIHDLLGPLNEVERKHAPQALFTAGDIRLLEEGSRVSIVGHRKASPEGMRCASRLADILAKRKIVVVSGLDEGINTAAHSSAIRSGGRTVGVTATPLDRFDKARNNALQDLIATDQLLISPFATCSPIRRKNILVRNQTMALISDSTVIVEAGETSGALNQGREALRLGRPLFIAKSVADDLELNWPAEMLGYGARILSDESLDELFDSLPPRLPVSLDGEFPF